MQGTRFLAVLLVGLLVSAGCATGGPRAVYQPANPSVEYADLGTCQMDHPDDSWACEPVSSSPVEPPVVLVTVGSVVLASTWIFIIAVLPFLLMGH